MKLKRTKQCSKCPWKVNVDPNGIPNGYTVDKHESLRKTIANKDNPLFTIVNQHVMACHETHNAHCIGWLHNQLGKGNNIALRISMMNCENISDIKIQGKQHNNFDETLPKQ
jgi:hypothetical protein